MLPVDQVLHCEPPVPATSTISLLMARVGLIGNMKRLSGFITLEILLAMTLLVMAICTLLPLVSGGQSASVGSLTTQEAIYKARDLLEQVYANSKVDFNLVNVVAPTSDGIYTKSVFVDTNLLNYLEKTVTSTVSWRGDHGQTLQVYLSSLMVNPEGLTNGDVCNSVVVNPNGWKNPIYYTWDFGDLGVNGNNGNGFAVSNMQNYQQKLYVTMSDTPNTDKDTFFVFNLPSDPSQMPIFQWSLDNATTVSGNLKAVAVSGNYAYVVSSYGANFTTCAVDANCAQLQVIDLATHEVVKNMKMPVLGVSGQGAGNSIFYDNGYVYVGLAKTAGGPEFNIIDVGGGGASPVNPVWRGGYSVGAAVNSIVVKNGYAYIATPNAENMTIIDVNNSANPARVGGYTPSTGSNNGESIYAVGNTVYLGRTFGSNEFYMLNASNPSNVSVLGSRDVGTGNQTSINGLAVRNMLAFAITKGQFQVWDISDASNIKPWSPDGTTATFLPLSSLGGTGTSLYCAGDYFYTAIASSMGNTKDIIAIIAPGP